MYEYRFSFWCVDCNDWHDVDVLAASSEETVNKLRGIWGDVCRTLERDVAFPPLFMVSNMTDRTEPPILAVKHGL